MPDEEVSINVRKIDNGYIIRRSTTDSKGNYRSVEQFSPTKPVLPGVAKTAPAAKPAPATKPAPRRKR